MPTPVQPASSVAPASAALRLRRRVFASLAAVVIGAFLAAGLALPAHAAGSGTLTVRVVTKSGTPISGLSKTNIQAVPIAGHIIDPFAATINSAAVAGTPGSYRFSVAAGEAYTIRVLDAKGAYSQLYGNTRFVDAAKTVTVGEGESRALDFSVDANVTIAGTVTGASGKAAKGIRVDAWRFDGSEWIAGWASATTSSKGTYSLTDLDPGSYIVEFTDAGAVGYLTQFSGGAKTFGAAAPISLGVGESAKANAKLAGGARLTGSATLLYQGRVVPASRVRPIAYPVSSADPATMIVDKAHSRTGADTTSNGVWSVGGLTAGLYIVRLADDASSSSLSLVGGYVGASGLVSAPTSAQVFTVATGKTTTKKDATRLALASGVSPSALVVSVTAPGGAPVADAEVSLESSDQSDYSYSSTAAHTATDGGGVLAIPRLPAGSYALRVTATDSHGHPLFQPYTETFSYAAAPGQTPHAVQLATLTSLGWAEAPVVSSPQLAVGATNSVTATANQAGTALSYQWLRDGTPIFGATSTSYTSTSGDLGRTLSVAVFATRKGLDPVSAVATVGIVAAGPQITAGASAPIISPAGTQPMGTTLSVTPGDWSVPGATFAIGWYSSADGYASAIATGATYTTAPTDIGDSIRVQVIAVKPGYTASVARFSAVVGVTLAAAPTLVKAPKVTYSAATDEYSVSAGTWSPATTDLAYAWTFDGNIVSEEPFVSVSNPHKTPLTVTVTPNPLVYEEAATARIIAFRGVASPSKTDAGSILASPNGDPVGSSIGWGTTLDADSDPLVWTYPDPGSTSRTSSTYQWFSGSYSKHTAISGATHATFTPGSTLAGSSVYLVRSSTDASWATATAASPLVRVTSNSSLVDTPATVVITGNRAHSTLSVAVGSWSGATVTRQWMTCNPTLGACTGPADYSVISKATAATYTTSYAQQGRQLIVKATGKKKGCVTATSFSAPVTLDRGLAVLAKAPKVTLIDNGGPQTWSVSAGTWSPSAGSLSYQWYLDGSPTPANGSPSNLWGLNVGAGKSLVVVVTFTPTDSTIAPASTTVVVQKRAASDISTGSQTLHGSTFGDSFSLPGDPFTYTPSNAAHSLTYSWSVGGKPVKGATSSTYTPSATAVGKVISLTVTSRAAGYPDAIYTAPGVTLLAAAAASAVPTMTFTSDAPRPGTMLTADTSAYDPAFALSYQWQSRTGVADFVPIAGATASAYLVPTSAPGRDIRVVVTATRSGHATAITPSTPVTISFGLPIVSKADPIVSGTGAVQSKLSATPGFWSTTGLTFSYQWMRGGVALPGATAATYVPLASALGDDIWVAVMASRAGYQSVSEASSHVTVVVAGAPTSTVLPKISGTPLIGSPLTVSTGTWSIDGLTFSYQWFEGDLAHPIDGATANSYEPTDAPRSVFAVVTATRDGYLAGSARSAAVTVRTQ